VREPLEIAPFEPTPLEVYVACRALRQPIPRLEVKRLKRARLINSAGNLSADGNYEIGRLRQLRKDGKVAAKASGLCAHHYKLKDGELVPARKPDRSYPGLGSRRERRFNKKQASRELERLKRMSSAIETTPVKEPLFASAYR